ncbi:Peptidase family M48 [compost metagenome]
MIVIEDLLNNFYKIYKKINKFMKIKTLNYMRFFHLLACIIFLSNCAKAQTIYLNNNGSCDFFGLSNPSIIRLLPSNSFSSSNEASKIVEDMVSKAGLKPNFTVSEGDVPNASAFTNNGTRYIAYNRNFMSQVINATNTNWSAISILAHEVGHHLNGHTLDGLGSRPNKELEADEYSGFILRKMGATLTQAKIAMSTIGSDHGSNTHPSKTSRLEAIARGWNRANGSDNGSFSNPQSSQTAMINIPCQHKMQCQHSTPCTHTIPCQHNMPCQHPIACNHIQYTPYGPRALHQADAMHAFDLQHQFDLIHQFDFIHQFDLLHQFDTVPQQ